MNNEILLVEDEPEIREMMVFTLTRAGYRVTEAASAEVALQRLEGVLPSLVLIDWMLPGMTGIDLAKHLRRDELTKDLPLLMLTARGEEADKLKGFDAGVDDYITKPFSPRELIARVKANLRRAGNAQDGLLEAGALCVDTNAHRLLMNGKSVDIGPIEYRLLAQLMSAPDRAFDRAQLLDRVWGRSVYVEERTVDVHVLRLRKVLKPHGYDHHIETVRGIGYRFNPTP